MALSNTPFTIPSIDLLIFDCDGVLIDSEILSKRVLLLMLNNLGVSVNDEYFDRYFLGHSYTSVKAKIYEDFSIALSDQFRQNYLDSLLQVFKHELTPTEKLEKMLTQLKTRFCVATSSSPERAKFALETTGLHHFFNERIFTSSEVENGKPAPDIFLHAAKKMGVSPSNCLVIEDSQAGIKAALAAKMRVIKYAGATHLAKKAATNFDQTYNITTIFHWDELFELAPTLIHQSS